ncbi:leukotriene B4 receptor 1-like [Brienomyrus brachyistius]|uniref:leukotriene B4 receptor 1-like n=1 Tax=Brienomyrus brachyistius TaxID=42636 RepID=UPI0020B272CE|nr:leukotriene B4 receptor 1-like [Brienomyrus brachyistius]
MNQSNTSSSWDLGILTEAVAPSVVLGLCFLIGVPGNITVIVVILRHFKRENFTMKLLLNLAASDILCLISLPVWIYELFYGWRFGNIGCKLMMYMVFCSLYGSLLTVTLMSVQRYVQVLYSQYWVRLRGTGQRVLLVSVWVVACVLASYSIVLGKVLRDGGIPRCDTNYSSDGQRLAVLLSQTLLGFVIPFSVIVTSYCCLHKKVKQRTFFINQRMKRLIISIVVTFFIFWIPVHVVSVTEIFSILLKSSHPAASAKLEKFCSFSSNILGSLSFINSCINPFLYAFALRYRHPDATPSKITQDVSTSNL